MGKGRKEEGTKANELREGGKNEERRNDGVSSEEDKDKDKPCIPPRLRSFNFLLRSLKSKRRVRGSLVGGEGGGRHSVWVVDNRAGSEVLGAGDRGGGCCRGWRVGLFVFM